MTATATATDPTHPHDCENCHTPLQGAFCHQCGQSAHNPNKHLGHAVEEVFESFWHLDGRIFRTLRELLIPGKVAANYLRGQRVGYVQPLRLFVILTLFTFFVMKLTVNLGNQAVTPGNTPTFTAQTTVPAVEAERDRALAQLTASMGDNPALGAALGAAQAAVNQAAQQRIDQLNGVPVQPPQTVGLTVDLPVDGRQWDAKSNPVNYALLPKFANDYLNHRLERMEENVKRMGNDATQYFKAMLTALPGALFVLMPIFALVLRVAYVGRAVGYLEHLVVALYSHAWLLMTVLTLSLISAGHNALGIAAVSKVAGMVSLLLLICVPVYLAVMQHRVYGGRYWATALRYALVGSVYFMLVTFVIIYAALAGISV